MAFKPPPLPLSASTRVGCIVRALLVWAQSIGHISGHTWPVLNSAHSKDGGETREGDGLYGRRPFNESSGIDTLDRSFQIFADRGDDDDRGDGDGGQGSSGPWRRSRTVRRRYRGRGRPATGLTAPRSWWT